jgi:hypothetical protein
MIQVRYPFPHTHNHILTQQSASVDVSGDEKTTSNGHIDTADNESVSPEVRKRLAKLQKLNDEYNVSDEDFEVEIAPSPKKTQNKSRTKGTAVVASKTIKGKKGSKPTQLRYTVDIVLATWNEEDDYGKSFRAMQNEDQADEVKRLNLGTTKGLKGVIKKKLLHVNYKAVVTAKMQAYLGESRMPLTSMFHVPASTMTTVMLNPSFMSVGEWVEVDADRTPGYNSEGGVAVVVAVADAVVDVK